MELGLPAVTGSGHANGPNQTIVRYKIAPEGHDPVAWANIKFGDWNEYELSFRNDPHHKAVAGVTNVKLIDVAEEWGLIPLPDLYSSVIFQGGSAGIRNMFAEVVDSLDDVRILTEHGSPIVHLVFRTHSVPIALAGDGISCLVRWALELASQPDGVILLEEPEVHQHPATLRLLAQAILAATRRGVQVVLSTHSLELIDSLLAQSDEEDLGRLSLYKLNLKDGELLSARRSGPDVRFAREEIERDLR